MTSLGNSTPDPPVPVSSLSFLSQDLDCKRLAANPDLTQLTAQSCGLQDREVRVLAQSSTLQTLSLPQNFVGDLGAQALAANSTLTSLHLSGNRVGNDGARALAHSTSLTELDLGWNELTDEGAVALVANPYLRTLALNGASSIGAKSAAALRENSTLTHLSIRQTGISGADVQSLHDARTDWNQSRRAELRSLPELVPELWDVVSEFGRRPELTVVASLLPRRAGPTPPQNSNSSQTVRCLN